MWSNLPEPVLIHIFSHLSLDDIFLACLTCRRWFVLDSATLWKKVQFGCYADKNDYYNKCWQLKIVEKYGFRFNEVIVLVDQSQETNRRHSINLLERIALVPERQICKLKLCFVGANPMLYGGQDYYPVLQLLFSSSPEEGAVFKKTLTHLDLGQFTVTLRDPTLQGLAYNHTTLTHLDIQNKLFICLVTESCLATIVRSCRHLIDLRVHSVSLNDDVIKDVGPTLRHLSVFCLRQENSEISDLAWLRLKSKNPDIRVTLKFDHMVPLWKYRSTMSRAVPLTNLHIQTFTMVQEQVEIAVDIFSERLKVIHIISQPSEELDKAVLHIATLCTALEQLHVQSSLDNSTIEDVLKFQSQMASNKKSYTLTNEFERPADLADMVLEEIQSKFK